MWTASILLLLSQSLAAQEVLRVPVDRIVAVVGDTPIPLSRLQEQENTWRSQGGQLPEDPETLLMLKRRLLSGLIDQELMVQAAAQDTMVLVTEEDVQGAVDETMQNIRENFASELDMERELQSVGFGTVEEYRLWLADQQRRSLLQEALIQELRTRGEIVALPATEEELRAYYEANKDQFGERPATVSFRQIVVMSEPDSTALRVAFAKADSIRGLLVEGEDFGELARLFSADSGSAVRGGDLGWFRRGQGLVREFEDAAFRLRPGAFSLPVYTTYGFHIIQVQRAEPASVQARHILIAPALTAANREAARQEADSVLRQLRAGVPYDSLVRLHHSRPEERVAEDAPRDNLPESYRVAFALAEPGDILGPVELDRGNGKVAYAVIILEGSRPAGMATFEDIRGQLGPRLAEQNGVERYLRTLRQATYVDIRLPD
jgi:peptidyl-prolyl cis-trans isomerase SurA